MEATRMVTALQEIRQHFEKPPSDLDIIRHSLQQQIARLQGKEMPPLLNDEQRKVFTDNFGLVEDFVASEDGADAIELLIGAFDRFRQARMPTVEVAD